MKKSNLTFSSILFTLILISFISFASTRKIRLTGMVVDSENYQPQENAQIFDSKNNLIGKTDQNGFFEAIINVEEKGEINFGLIIKKNGYENLSQKEHWGDLEGENLATYYFGIKNRKGTKSDAFSELAVGTGSESVSQMKSEIEKIAKKRDFLKKIESLKMGNDDVYFLMDSKPYLVNESGFIALNSPGDLISINKKERVQASKLNDKIHRKEVGYMSTTSSREIAAEIFTK